MGTDTAVAVAVKGVGVAAVPAVPFASDEIHELGFLSLLHSSLTLALRDRSGVTGGTCAEVDLRAGLNGGDAVPGGAKNVLASI
jgi:hypothetical protein